MSSRFWGSPDRSKNTRDEGTATADFQAEPSEHGSDDVRRTVTLTERDLRAASRLLSILAGLEDDRGKELTKIVDNAGPTLPNCDREQLMERARQTFANRSKRSQFFHRVMFGEPAWDMLLALYVTEKTGARHTVSGLLNLSGVPPTTALRWLDFLRKNQLVTRRSNPTDRRVYYIELSEDGRRALDAYFSATMAAEI